MSTIIDYASVPNGELFPLSSLTKRIAELEAERGEARNLLRTAWEHPEWTQKQARDFTLVIETALKKWGEK